MTLTVLQNPRTAADVSTQFFREALTMRKSLVGRISEVPWYEAQWMLASLHDSAVGYVIGGDYARAYHVQEIFDRTRSHPAVKAQRTLGDCEAFDKFCDRISIEDERVLLRRTAASLPLLVAAIAKDFEFTSMLSDTPNVERANAYFDEEQFHNIVERRAKEIPQTHSDAGRLADYLNSSIAVGAIQSRQDMVGRPGDTFGVSAGGRWPLSEGAYEGFGTVPGISATTFGTNNAADYYGRCESGVLLSITVEKGPSRDRMRAFAKALGEKAARRTVGNGRTIVEEFDVIGAYDSLARANGISAPRRYAVHQQYRLAEHFGGVLNPMLMEYANAGVHFADAVKRSFDVVEELSIEQPSIFETVNR